MTTENLNAKTETADSELNISSGSSPLTLEEYTKTSQDTFRDLGFAVPTNPTFYEKAYAHHLKDWQEKNRENSHEAKRS